MISFDCLQPLFNVKGTKSRLSGYKINVQQQWRTLHPGESRKILSPQSVLRIKHRQRYRLFNFKNFFWNSASEMSKCIITVDAVLIVRKILLQFCECHFFRKKIFPHSITVV